MGAQAWPRAEFGSIELPVGWFSFCRFWHEVLTLALAAGGVGQGFVPRAGVTLRNPWGDFSNPGKHRTQKSSQEAWEEDFSRPWKDVAVQTHPSGQGMYGTAPVTSPLQADSTRGGHSSLGWFPKLQKPHRPISTCHRKVPSVSLSCACTPLITLPGMGLHQLPALKFCSILNPL